MNSNIVPNSFVAISDFHSIEYPLEKVKKYYIEEYDKIFILGDATDRGENGVGQGGVRILESIKELSEQYPGRVIYIPGNHDTFLYEYGKFNKPHLLDYQGQLDTINDITDLRENDPDRLNSLITWLGNLPLQRVHEYDGKKYVFAHAFFNQNLYKENPNYSLEMMYQLASIASNKTKEKYNALYKVLWYRHGDPYDKEDVPVDVIEVIGHTPLEFRRGLNLNLENSTGGWTKVVCVDGGVAYEFNKPKHKREGSMLKFDGSDDDVLRTPFYQHTDTSPKNSNRQNSANAQNDFSVLIESIKETTNRQGIEHMKNVLWNILNRRIEPHGWDIYFSRGHRNEVMALGLEKISDIIYKYSNLNDPDSLESVVNVFFEKLYEEDAEFKQIVDKKEKHFKEKNSIDYTVELGDKPGADEENLGIDYVSLYGNDGLFVVFRVDDSQMSVFIDELIKKYGEYDVNNCNFFDYNVLIDTLNFNETALLGNSGYAATNDNGNIVILDSSGKNIYSFNSDDAFENSKHWYK